MYSLTTGGASNEERQTYYQQKIDGLYQDVFGFMSWQLLLPFIAHGVQQLSCEQRANLLKTYEQHLLNSVVNKQ
ncbi:hypothetical protein HG263_16715 [Pseudoalteromonas sp. JBTF-M23]|uniref:Uncharacterized protein n=1 Tax=Pseudoalteromonas caenipelagi TaxID=2726988 RepID=A0A849VI71_9GAMM|nr:hypothetical protein [Pseudoalteromonas caenipelagi]NOU52173.1 hypothetical protein [Pseudoalteromonas caenipelagi]